jgi:Response regulator receiver domain
MDLIMPPAGGTSAIQEITRSVPKARVLVLTMHDDPAYLQVVLAAGASGYVLKRSVECGNTGPKRFSVTASCRCSDLWRADQSEDAGEHDWHHPFESQFCHEQISRDGFN